MTFGAAAAGEMLADRYRLEEHVDTDAGRPPDLARHRHGAAPPGRARHPPARRRGRGRHAHRGRGRQPAGAPAHRRRSTTPSTRATAPTWSANGCPASPCATCCARRRWTPSGPPWSPTRSPRRSPRCTPPASCTATSTPAPSSIADDGRVVLADAHADAPTDAESDVRAVGAVLYACLTGHWPYAEAGRSSAARRGPRRRRPARHARARSAAASRATSTRSRPTCSTRRSSRRRRQRARGRVRPAGHPGRRSTSYDDRGTTRYGSTTTHGRARWASADRGGGGRRRAGGKLALGVAVLTVDRGRRRVHRRQAPRRRPRPGPDPAPVRQPAGDRRPHRHAGQPIALTAGPDPDRRPAGRRPRPSSTGFEKIVDGNETTGWTTDEYNQANFGAHQAGHGHPHQPRRADQGRRGQGRSSSQQGASIALRAGTSRSRQHQPRATRPSSTIVHADRSRARTTTAGTDMVFPVPQDAADRPVPAGLDHEAAGRRRRQVHLTVNEITVLAPMTPMMRRTVAGDGPRPDRVCAVTGPHARPRRRGAAARPRRRRPGRVRRAGPPPPRPAVGGRPAHPRRPRGGGRRGAGRAGLRLPRRPTGSAATRPSPPGCTASWSTPASTGCAAGRPDRRCRCPRPRRIRRPRRRHPPTTGHRPGRPGRPGPAAARAAGRAGPARHAGLLGRRDRRRCSASPRAP